MKRIITLFLVFSIYCYASLIGSNFSQRDLQVLEDLDIETSFITDYDLQRVYAQFQNRRNSQNYIETLDDASMYVPRVKDILAQEQIPPVFIYMAMAESNFDIDARSHVHATGLWQFMNGTAKRYGLRIDYYVDERMDLVKSTIAAAKYLNALHKRFDKWYLAAIAYNCGEGRVIEAITRATLDKFIERFPKQKNSKRIRNFRNIIKAYQDRRAPFYKLNRVYKEVRKWGIEPTINDLLKVQAKIDRQYLPRETRTYIRKIISLAMLNSDENIKLYKNPHLLNLGISASIATVPVKGGWDLGNIAETIGMDFKELYALNKHLKRKIVPPTDKYYTINIPYNRLSMYNFNKGKIKDTKYAIHVVKRGETLSSIAKKYGTSYKLIKKKNKLKSNFLSLNQRLILPIPESMIERKDILSSALRKSKKRHIVKSGDSLSSIARRYKIDIKKLMKDNKLKNSFLKIGDRLVIR